MIVGYIASIVVKHLFDNYKNRHPFFKEFTWHEMLSNYNKASLIINYFEKYPLERAFLMDLKLNLDQLREFLSEFKPKDYENKDLNARFTDFSGFIAKKYLKVLPLELLGNLYKKVKEKEQYIILDEIKRREPEVKFMATVCYLPLIYSKPDQYVEEKSNFLKGNFDNQNKFKLFCYHWLSNPSSEMLVTFYKNSKIEHKIWLLPLFLHLDHAHVHLEMLLNIEHSILEPSKSMMTMLKETFVSVKAEENYFKKELINTLDKLKSQLVQPQDINHAFCTTCKRRLIVKGSLSYQYLICPVCESTKDVVFNLNEVKAVLAPTHTNEFLFWDFADKKPILIEADILELSEKNPEVDLDWAVSAYIQAYENAFVNKKLKVKLSNSNILQANTIRNLEKNHVLEIKS